jgi:predicted GNAT family N-acyltransferase
MKEMIYKLVENDQELKGAYEVRRQVFVDEQGISEDLVFSGDKATEEMTMVAMDGGMVIGTARVQLMANNIAKIERMAVLRSFRQQGVGRGIISFLDEQLKHKHVKYVFLHAQHAVIDFYKSCGFNETGLPFYEAGIKHIKMETQY